MADHFVAIGDQDAAMGQLSSARRAYEHAMRLSPTLGLSYIGMGELALQNPAEGINALPWLRTAVELLPFALWSQFEASWNHVAVIPASAVLAIFLFGIDELAVTLEEPFSILPLEALTGNSIDKVNQDVVRRSG